MIHFVRRARLLTGVAPLAVLFSVAVRADDQSTQQQSWSIIDRKAANADLFSFDYGVPASPAITLAGLADANLSPSTSLKPFVLSLPGLLGDNSSQTSAALDMAPAWIFSQEDSVSPAQYRKKPITQLLFRTRLGVVLSKGDAGSGDPTQQKPSRAAIGLSTSLLSSSDPVLAMARGGTETAWQSCVNLNRAGLEPYDRYSTPEASKLVNDSQDISAYLHRFRTNNAFLFDNVKARVEAIEADIQVTAKPSDFDGRADLDPIKRLEADQADIRAFKNNIPAAETEGNTKAAAILVDCRKQASDAAQHGAALDIGAGAVWSGIPGQWANFSNPNAAVWIAGRYPLDFGKQAATDCGDSDNRTIGDRLVSCWMIGGSGRYSAGEMVATGDTTTPQFKATVLEGWLGLERIDSKSKFGAYYGYLNQSAADSVDKGFSRSGDRWLFSAAYSLDFLEQGLWLQGSYGAANGSVSTLDDKVALLTLTFSPPSLGSGFVQKDNSSSSNSQSTPPPGQ